MIVAIVMGLAISVQASQQAPNRVDGRAAPQLSVPAPTDSSATAVRAAAAPVIDGRDNDQVWQTAPEITGFKQWRPSEGKPPRYKTEAKIAYDAANLYVFVRAFDPHPDSIIKLLERRDSYTSSDMFWLFIDSYHDRRTGYEFGVNAAGVKTDAAIYDDGNEDFAWDGVWDVETRIDSLGWTAEYRIPLSQMRYSGARTHTFGIIIDRVHLPVRGARELAAAQAVEARIRLAVRTAGGPGRSRGAAPARGGAVRRDEERDKIVNNAFTQKSNVAVGGDVKYRVAPNLTLDATINPDFGQVEADPAVLNLTAYESLLRRAAPVLRGRPRTVPVQRQLQPGQLQRRRTLLQPSHRPHAGARRHLRRHRSAAADNDPRRRQADRPIPDAA